MAQFTQPTLAAFAGVVARAWNDPAFQQTYENDPQAVLTQYGITLPPGVPMPVIPARPQSGIVPAPTVVAQPANPAPGLPQPADGWSAFPLAALENWDLTIQPLQGQPAGAGPGNAQLAVSTLACAACPVSSFSSLSN